VLALLGFGLFLALTPAEAEQLIGRVQALYVQAAPGVLMEAAGIGKGSAHAPGESAQAHWADVEVDGRMHLVRVPAELRMRVGDRVSVRLSEPRSTHIARVLPTVAESRALSIEPAGARVAEGLGAEPR
jgi:hypothetical protein